MQQCSFRRQQTLATPVELAGFGLFSGVDVRIRLRPAPIDHGIVIERIDLPQPVRIPALVEYVVPQPRCTVLQKDGTQVAVVEHLLAALAGLRVDNCLVQIDAGEVPIFDGSALAFCRAIQTAGIIEQNAPRQAVRIEEVLVHTESADVAIAAQPGAGNDCEIGFFLDYGVAAIPTLDRRVRLTPTTFLDELASSRTFALEEEVHQLREHGLAKRATPANALVFTRDGILDNQLRFPDECVRHKLLDCVGDFALLGMDLIGRFTATRSGHRLNHALIREIRDRLQSPRPTKSAASPVPPPHRSSRSRKAVAR